MIMKIQIIGGGIIGASTAYHLSLVKGLDITLFEKDLVYTNASFARSCGGFRHQFSCESNIRMGMYGLDFIKKHGINFTANGYLMVFGEEQKDDHDQSFDLQKRCGSNAISAEPHELLTLFPWLNVDDVYRAVYTQDGSEGWLDPYELQTWYMKKAKENGIKVIEGDGLKLVDVDSSDAVVITSGCWTSDVAKNFGIDIPGKGHKHTVINFKTTHEHIPSMPLIADLITGAYVRPEGPGYISGHDGNGQWDSEDLEPNWEHWETHWADLYQRSSVVFEAIKPVSAWAGYYDTSLIDSNAIVDSVDKYHFATGFTGRGLMQSPAIGLALSQQILGEKSSFDMSDFLLNRTPNKEKYVI